MKHGVLGGTFDPIHNGHLTIAEEVRQRLGLGEVILVPTGRPWMRASPPLAAAAHRVQMVRLAISGRPGYRLSTLEIERAGPSYAVDTIIELRKQLGSGDEVFFILGWDSLAELPRWHEPSRLVAMCSIVVVPRPGYPRPRLKSLDTLVPGLAKRAILLDAPHVDISASEVRERVSQGLSISHLVPEAVANYIGEHGLYASRDNV
jgi:nicotinate-nucleotide adenylyltransferase